VQRNQHGACNTDALADRKPVLVLQACSARCRRRARVQHHQKYPRIKVCVICGKEYEPSASKRKTGKVCSKECKTELDKIHAAKRKKPISQFTLDDKFVKTWDSAREVQNELGFCESNINKCLKGNIKTAYGYKWEYSVTVNVVEDIARAIGDV
jgi:hypothetical protein